jgi:thiol-disulfide isomerase/thioredoxin
MIASRTPESVNWRGALIGAALFLGLSLLVHFTGLENPPPLPWLASAFALAGALIGHLTLRNAMHLVGAAIGMAIGLFTGAIVGDAVGGYIPVEQPEAASPGTREGQPLEIAGPTLDGGSFDVKDWHGKIVLVDFWATWCGPCVAEIPNVKKVYNRYHKDGFEVVGVSLDENPENLAAFVKKHELAWPQIIFPDPAQRKWDSPLVRRYDIHGIPAMFLLDREGKIASRDIDGERLASLVEQLHTGVRVGLFPMGLFIGACIGGYAGIQLGGFVERAVRRKRVPSAL